MQKIKLLKSLLVPTLGISAIGSIAAVSTSCGEKKPIVIHVTDVILNKSSTTLAVGGTETLTATVLPETATDKSVTWTSSNPSVATVDSNGNVTAVGEGTATITVTSVDNHQAFATCGVTVNDAIHVTNVSLDKSETTLDVGGTETLTATVLPEDATDKSVTWTSRYPSVATVDSNGKITAKRQGTTIIAVKTNDSGIIATCAVTVNAIHVTKVKLNKSSTTLDAGATEQLTATVLPENATDKSTTWTSSNPSVATVDSNGTITAVAKGTTTITVKTNDGGYTDTCEVNVISKSYVVVTANATSKLLLSSPAKPDLQYSFDEITWTAYSTEIDINQGQNLYLKGNNPNGWSKGFSQYSTLSITGDVSISGNVMGLLDNGAKPGEQGNITVIPCADCFYDLFQNSTGIKSVSEDFLPATKLQMNCYCNMFAQCTSLTTAPELPATTLAGSCYQSMFEGCTSLVNVPTKLSATKLMTSCYSSMFQGCTSLTTAPDLPAMNLASYCYRRMFRGCTSLTTAPDLPAITLANDCYSNMFNGCKSLNSIKIAYTGNYDSKYFNNWVSVVAIFGTFYYNGTITETTAHDFQLPSSWTVQPFNQ